MDIPDEDEGLPKRFPVDGDCDNCGHMQVLHDERRCYGWNGTCKCTAVPHIARAAQVEALREMADELDSFAGRLDGPAAVVARSCASIVRGKSRDMEAGAGQTGERN